MSYPDYTSAQTLQLTPVTDVLLDLRQKINIRITNLNVLATSSNGTPISPIELLPSPLLLTENQAIYNLLAKMNVITPYFMRPVISDFTDLDFYTNHLVWADVISYAGYSAAPVYYGRPPTADIFIQIDKMLDQLKYIDYYYIGTATRAVQLAKADPDRATFITKSFASGTVTYGYIHQPADSYDHYGYNTGVCSYYLANIPANIAVYHVQRDSRWVWETESYDYSFWQNFWGIGETQFSFLGNTVKGGNITVPVVYPDLSLLPDPADGARDSVLQTIMMADMSIDYS